MQFGEYYIAYFDVLGCKSYFSGDERTEFDFVQNLNGMVNTAVECARSISSSRVLGQQADMHIEYRLFSDNVALFMKVGDSQLEIVRLLTFLEAISSAQRETMFSYKLLLCGGVVKGRLYLDESFFVGKGLTILRSEYEKLLEGLKQTSPKDYESVQKNLTLNNQEKLEEYLRKHKEIVLEKIKSDCNYGSVDKKNPKAVAAKARVIQKFKWLVVFHNRLCYLNKKPDFVINVSYTFDPVTLNDYMSVPIAH